MPHHRKTSFGIYRGSPVYLMHIAYGNQDTTLAQLPMICKMATKPLPAHYYDFLARKVGEGFKSNRLLVGLDDSPIHQRIPGTHRYQEVIPHFVLVLNRFKQHVRRYLARRIVRQKFRAAQIHEELVSVVWSPAAVQKRVDMGLTLDEVFDL